jgi:hypothetical protein
MTPKKLILETIDKLSPEYQIYIDELPYEERTNEEQIKGAVSDFFSKHSSYFIGAEFKRTPNVPCSFKKGVVKTVSTITGNKFKKEVDEGIIIEHKGSIIKTTPTPSSNELIDLMLRFRLEDGEELNIAWEFKNRNKENYFGKDEGRGQQEPLAIIKDLERLTAILDINNMEIDSPWRPSEFMFMFTTDCFDRFVEYKNITVYDKKLSFNFGEGLEIEFNGYKFNFKYKKRKNLYFLTFASWNL